MNLHEIAQIAPSPRQLNWQRLEFYGFIHFGMNTMTGREWGEGHEDPALFDPDRLNADEWAALLQASGMRAVILTCKHHDGFCLWPSRHSAHTVANAPWKGGRGDLVREVSDACRRRGLKFGVYLSPWDRTESRYGEGAPYDDFYVNQLEELLTGYGEVACVWLDGANGEGPSGRRQQYDWDRYYDTVRRLQPDCVISVCGPDIRWVGNEAGETRAEEWSVVPAPLRDAEKTAEKSQQADDGAFSRSFESMEADLGSRQAIAAYDGDWVWYPAEVNTSIRPGWFYHAEEDDRVRGADELFRIYVNAVGGNATFLLNVPPNARGEIAAPDRAALLGLGERIARLQDDSLMRGAAFAVSGRAGAEDGLPAAVADLSPLSAGAAVDASARAAGSGIFPWKPAAGEAEPWVEWSLPHAKSIDAVSLGEHLPAGQRIEQFEIRAWTETEPDLAEGAARDEERPAGTWVTVAQGSVVGYRRIVRFAPVLTAKLRVVFTGYREFPTLSHVQAHSLEANE
ncbi:alpha-L-fucosidase [Saccharibacillus brassicae]|uniref:alpha-L-fucosidase n=1 Tax=Saccharibacillus brassicae TaxID=2583377 RepID=A0A4Y6V422_SACBS|nr:alpha-L-fucosidase [Saccharibacillus brassicae]QDH23316.1 alpha-L-fucosidase [Saccharibacillus brassicae]